MIPFTPWKDYIFRFVGHCKKYNRFFCFNLQLRNVIVHMPHSFLCWWTVLFFSVSPIVYLFFTPSFILYWPRGPIPEKEKYSLAFNYFHSHLCPTYILFSSFIPSITPFSFWYIVFALTIALLWMKLIGSVADPEGQLYGGGLCNAPKWPPGSATDN